MERLEKMSKDELLEYIVEQNVPLEVIQDCLSKEPLPSMEAAERKRIEALIPERRKTPSPGSKRKTPSPPKRASPGRMDASPPKRSPPKRSPPKRKLAKAEDGKCPDGYILNPKTKRCVKLDSQQGKQIARELGLMSPPKRRAAKGKDKSPSRA